VEVVNPKSLYIYVYICLFSTQTNKQTNKLDWEISQIKSTIFQRKNKREERKKETRIMSFHFFKHKFEWLMIDWNDLGFWNVSNSWTESRRRKGTNLHFFFWKVTTQSFKENWVNKWMS
jgi:hypothetical protein